mgnify:FL=1
MKPSTIVIKLGSSSLVNPDTKEPRLSIMSKMVETVATLKRQGHKVVIVSSGGVAMGMNAMHLDSKPTEIAEVQAIAAIGQGRLISKWDMLFQEYELEIAQILLTRNDILNWKQYRNAKNTINELLKMGVTPIVNENDTLSISEIEFGDNDTLSGVTAALIEADYLFLLTDVDCLYTNDPRIDPEAKAIITVNMDSKINPLKNVNTSSGSGSTVGTGGMKTKLISADLATKAGVMTLVMRSEQPNNITRIIEYIDTNNFKDLQSDEEVAVLNDLGLPLHTKFLPIDNDLKLENRQFWLLHGLVSKGSIIIDKEIYQNILEDNSENENSDGAISINYQGGLPASGIIDIQDTFHELDCVNLKVGRRLSNGELDPDFPLKTVGRARCNYTSTELNKIKGINRGESVTDFLGYSGSDSDEMSVNQRQQTPKLSEQTPDNKVISKLADGLHECCIASRENLAFIPV